MVLPTVMLAVRVIPHAHCSGSGTMGFYYDTYCSHYTGDREPLLPSSTKLRQGYVFTRVCDSVKRGCLPHCMLGYTPLPDQKQTPPRDQRQADPPPPRTKGRRSPPPGPKADPQGDDYCCGWYASYWNGLLFSVVSVPVSAPVPFPVPCNVYKL